VIARFLLDTNVLSEPLRPEPSARLLKALREHEGRLATAAPVWHELRFGLGRLPRSRRKTRLESYLEDVVRRAIPILPYDEEAAAWHADRRAKLVRRGRTPSFVDGQIAAIAAVRGLTVVTGNTRDFRPFGVKLADWL